MDLAGTQVEIVGVPDFLLPARLGYAIRDSKLSRSIGNHIEIELQLQLYGQTFGGPPVALQVHAGGGEILDLAYDGGQPALESLEVILALRLATEPPPNYVAASKRSGCAYFERCWSPAVEQGVVGLVPGLDRGLRAGMSGPVRLTSV